MTDNRRNPISLLLRRPKQKAIPYMTNFTCPLSKNTQFNCFKAGSNYYTNL